jgi:hypothetical protein
VLPHRLEPPAALRAEKANPPSPGRRRDRLRLGPVEENPSLVRIQVSHRPEQERLTRSRRSRERDALPRIDGEVDRPTLLKPEAFDLQATHVTETLPERRSVRGVPFRPDSWDDQALDPARRSVLLRRQKNT